MISLIDFSQVKGRLMDGRDDWYNDEVGGLDLIKGYKEIEHYAKQETNTLKVVWFISRFIILYWKLFKKRNWQM